MGGDAQNTPMDGLDPLAIKIDLQARLAAAIEVINRLDESWPHLRGTLECRFCKVQSPHHAQDCKAKFILGA